MEALVFVGFVILVIAAGWFAWQQKKKRRLALQAFAKQYGMQYSTQDPFALVNYSFSLFQKGEDQGVENVLWGDWQGLPVKAADFWYYTETTDSKGNKSRHYHHYSVAIAEVPLALMPLSIAPEGVFTRLADKLGFHDIDFESEDFNRRYNVKAPDREYAFKVVDARMMAWLLTLDGFGFETVGPWVLAYCRRRKPAELVPLFGAVRGFEEHIPRLVRNEFAIDERKETTS